MIYIIHIDSLFPILKGLDDDALISAVRLRVNNSVVNIKNFSSRNQSGEIVFAGHAELVSSSPSSSSSSSSSSTSESFQSSTLKGKPKSHSVGLSATARVSLCGHVEINSEDAFMSQWSKYLYNSPSRRGKVGGNNGSNAPGKGLVRPSLQYSTGAVWLSDQKFVSKGFQFSCTFLCDWISLMGHLSSSFLAAHSTGNGSPVVRSLRNRAAEGLQKGREGEEEGEGEGGERDFAVVVGSVNLCLHSDRRGAQVPLSAHSSDPLSAVADSLYVSASFHGTTRRYYMQIINRIDNIS